MRERVACEFLLPFSLAAKSIVGLASHTRMLAAAALVAQRPPVGSLSRSVFVTLIFDLDSH